MIAIEDFTGAFAAIGAAAFLGAYLIGSIPSAYTVVRAVTGDDVTQHGTGNVGAMNVRRTTGSWFWFAVVMVADVLKGALPVFAVQAFSGVAIMAPASEVADGFDLLVPQLAVAGAVIGHNYSLWLAIKKGRFTRTGKGLATGAGAVFAYDWRYFVAVVTVGLLVIAVTRYMMAGQVAAAVALPVAAVALGSSDWPFALLMGAVVYVAHHRRFVGLLRGEEPKLYIHDRQGPRG